MANDSTKIKKSINVEPLASPTLDQTGDVGYNSGSDVLQVRNSGSTDTLAQIAKAQSLSNKTFSDAIIGTQIATPSNPSAGTNKLYFKSDGKLYSLDSSGNESQYVNSSAGEPRQNFLFNSAFDIWQRGTSTTIANATSQYQADRWYVKNSLGTDGVITYSRIAGSSDMSKYAAQVQITTAPTAAQTNGTELFQTLDNITSLGLFNQTGSFSIRVKALGNVNQVGVQFYYATTEVKVDTTIGSEQTASVTAGAFSDITISGQALGTSFTSAGVIGVRIRITGVSSGNTYDLNNGYIVEKAMLNIGTTAANYQRANKFFTDEEKACQMFYEKSYNRDVSPGTAATAGLERFIPLETGNQEFTSCRFKVTKRSTPSVTVYSTDGTSGQVRNTDAGANRAASATNIGLNGFGMTIDVATADEALAWFWAADAEI